MKYPMLLLLGIMVVCSTTAAAQNPSRSSPAHVRIVGPPKWWIVPRQEGNLREGKLYFGAVVQNDSNETIELGLSFQSYLEDGTKYEGCTEMGGTGPGVTAEIAAKEKALLVCHRAIVPNDLKGLQVTTRLWDTTPLSFKSVPARVIESALTDEPWSLDKEERKYNSSARVQNLTQRDVKARVVFRFYDQDGVQVATCGSDDVLIEPEVVLRTTCLSSVYVDTGTPQPRTVRAEIRPPRW